MNLHSVKLLDCTLRDGGYINDWNFGEKAIRGIIRKLSKTEVEMIEVGFIKGNCKVYDPDKTIFPDTDSPKNILLGEKNPRCQYVGMIDMSSPVDFENIKPRNADSVDGIRVIFKKNKIDLAFDYCKHVKAMGYILFVNFVNTDLYTDNEFIDGLERFSVLEPDAMTIVDTFGLIMKKDFLRLAMIADNNLNQKIALCYHAHNNLQQAFENAKELLKLNLNRDVYIDASVFGMGRGAGNLNMELLAGYLNSSRGKNYRIEPMLEIMDEYLTDIYRQKFWGYSLPFYLSASLGCHPNYAVFLSEKETLPTKNFYELLQSISDEDKIYFNKEKAEIYYRKYLARPFDDSKTVEELTKIFHGKDVLILAPGNNLIEFLPQIKNELGKENRLVISINFSDERFLTDYIFVSNMKKYNQLPENISEKVITTSNILDHKKARYTINFSDYTSKEPKVMDNAGLMALRLVHSLCGDGAKIYVAGMDGYTSYHGSNFLPQQSETIHDLNVEEKNFFIAKELRALKKSMNIIFLTPTLYDLEKS